MAEVLKTSDLWAQLTAPKIPLTDIPIVYIIIFGFIIIGVFLYFRKQGSKEESFKRMSIYKSIKANSEKLCDIAEEDYGLGRNLKIGARDIGRVITAVYFNWYTDITKDDIKEPEFLKQISENLKTNNALEKLKALVVDNTNNKTRVAVPFYLFKVSGSGFVAALFARLGLGVKYYYVDKTLVSFSPFDIVINPNCSPTPFLDVVIFSEAGREVITDMAFKLSLENVLDELLNYTKKQTWLEVKQAENAAGLDVLAAAEIEKKKNLIEEMKKK